MCCWFATAKKRAIFNIVQPIVISMEESEMIKLTQATYIKELLCSRFVMDLIAAKEVSDTRNQKFSPSIAIDLIPFEGKHFRYS